MTDELARRHLDFLELLASSIDIGGEPRAILEAFLDARRLAYGENWKPTHNPEVVQAGAPR